MIDLSLVEEEQGEEEDSFTTSMIDLFGCGFIAAIFLFLIYAGVQRAAQAAAAVAANSAGTSAGNAATGPIFIEIAAPVGSDFQWGRLARFLSEAPADTTGQRTWSIVLQDGRNAGAWPITLPLRSMPAGTGAISVVMRGGAQEAISHVYPGSVSSHLRFRLSAAPEFAVDALGVAGRRAEILSWEDKGRRSRADLVGSTTNTNCGVRWIPRKERRFVIRIHGSPILQRLSCAPSEGTGYLTIQGTANSGIAIKCIPLPDKPDVTLLANPSGILASCGD